MEHPHFGCNDLHNAANAYVNTMNTIYTFVDSISPTNIITNYSILTQYSIKQGLKGFRQKGESLVQKNLQQSHESRFVEPNNPHELSYEQRIKSLAYL